ncbi:MFS transporter [Shimia sp.]|uniref:MFS transporter n=1 Tax=Shimia sp. TaxID=1954381 RepID=UPI003B8ABBC5
MTSTVTFVRENFRFLLPGILLSFLSSFGQTFFIALFAGEIRTEFGLSHGDWSGIYLIGTTASAVIMVWAGVLTDHFRVRILGAIILVGLAAACLAMANLSAVWMLPFVILALRFTGQGMLSHIAAVAMARWFVATRGRALAISALGFAIGQALLPLGVVAVKDIVDWHRLWVGGAVVSLLGIPILWALLAQERTPRAAAKANESFGMNNRHWHRKDALGNGLFWFIMPALLGPPAFNTAFFFHQVHFAEIKGWTHFDLVALYPMFTVVSTAAMLISGWLLDRLGTARLLPYYQLPMVVSFLAFAGIQSLWGGAIGLIAMALASGANATLITAFWAEFYGTKNIGGIKALAAAVVVFGSAVGPAIIGYLIDFGVGIELQFVGIALYFLVACGLVWVAMARYAPTLPKRAPKT